MCVLFDLCSLRVPDDNRAFPHPTFAMMWPLLVVVCAVLGGVRGGLQMTAEHRREMDVMREQVSNSTRRGHD